MPKRIQRKRTKGWRMPPGAVYVGRPTKWGNPFGVDRWEWKMSDSPLWSCVAVSSHAVVQRFHSREEAVVKAVAMFRHLIGLRGEKWLDCLWKWSIPEGSTTTNFDFLRGKDLVCWCRLDQPCHADVLLEIANR